MIIIGKTSSRFAKFRFVLLRFALIYFVSFRCIHFISFRIIVNFAPLRCVSFHSLVYFVAFRNISFRFVSFRFVRCVSISFRSLVQPYNNSYRDKPTITLKSCEFESRSGRGVQHYVIKFVSDLRQVGGFLRVLHQ